MKKRLRKYRLLVALTLALVLTLVPFTSVGAATTATVTITATPSYIAITIDSAGNPGVGNFTMGLVTSNTEYWGNLTAIDPAFPLQSATCTWQIDSTSSVNYDLDIHGGNMTGGVQWDLETIVGADDYTLLAGANGTANLAAMLVLSATDQQLASDIFKTTSVDFEMRLWTPSSFSDGVAKTGTVTITVTVH